ncbi:MAG: ABC transporter permease [Planctomycetaceae bacterium]|nr:ABC transporter permease [Planctomycetaceae bacterium]
MSILDRKLRRDLGHLATQAVAIAMVMASGIAMYTMALYALHSLQTSQTNYYQKYRFANIFCNAVRIPADLMPRIQALSGVSAIDQRVVFAALLDMPNMAEPVAARLISWPDSGKPRLNDLFLADGRWLDSERSDEVLASHSFVAAHGLKLDDQLEFVINGRKRRLQIVGVVYSPEYIVQIQPGSLLPDYKRFGVFWMSHRHLSAAVDMQGAVNDVTLTLERGATEAAVIEAVDELLAPYGGTGAYGRDQHVSHRFLEDEIKQLTIMAWVSPTIFLLVAAFLLNVMVGRVVALQREQIAVLKACGYYDWQIGVHYLKLALLIAVGGAGLGLLFGYWLGQNTTRMYAEVYRFPVQQGSLTGTIVWGSLLISIGSAVIGTWRSIAAVISLPPADAMRPATPSNFSTSWVERIGLRWLLPQIIRMLLRQIQRQPIKSLSTVFGMAMALAIMILGSFSLDAIRYLIWFQFDYAQRQDITVVFNQVTEHDVVSELKSLPGVSEVQTFRAIPMTVRHQHASRKISVMALGDEAPLYRLVNIKEQIVPTPPEGLVLSDKLAKILDADLGDRVQLTALEGTRHSAEIEVVRIITEYGGLNAYVSPQVLARWSHLPRTCSGAHLMIDSATTTEVYHRLKNMPQVASVNLKGAAMRSFEESFAANILTMRLFNIIFTVIIAFGVVYNHARISFAEQSRDLATLRVLGFTNGEVTSILLGELAILTVAALLPGCLIGWGLAAMLVWGMDTELYRIPMVIEPATYWFAMFVVVVAAFLSGLVMLRKIWALDMVSVLKARE